MLQTSAVGEHYYNPNELTLIGSQAAGKKLWRSWALPIVWYTKSIASIFTTIMRSIPAAIKAEREVEVPLLASVMMIFVAGFMLLRLSIKHCDEHYWQCTEHMTIVTSQAQQYKIYVTMGFLVTVWHLLLMPQATMKSKRSTLNCSSSKCWALCEPQARAAVMSKVRTIKTWSLPLLVHRTPMNMITTKQVVMMIAINTNSGRNVESCCYQRALQIIAIGRLCISGSFPVICLLHWLGNHIFVAHVPPKVLAWPFACWPTSIVHHILWSCAELLVPFDHLWGENEQAA